MEKAKLQRETIKKWKDERVRLNAITQTIKATAVIDRGGSSEFRGNKKRKERLLKQKKDQALVFTAVGKSLRHNFPV